MSVMSRHHRKCKSKGGDANIENIALVPLVAHEAYHTLFGNRPPWEVAKLLNDSWIDPEFKLVCFRKKIGFSGNR